MERHLKMFNTLRLYLICLKYPNEPTWYSSLIDGALELYCVAGEYRKP